ncbi:MAG: ABC transporter permease subunit [Thermoproteus sp.]|jgi:multiple sugar transport system permease protein
MRDKQILFLALPALVYLFSLTIYPIADNAVLSLYERTYEGTFKWVGLGNYLWLFQKDPYGPLVVWNTILYSVATPVISIALAIPIALAVRRLGGKWLLPLMVPAFIPPVTAAMAWYLMLNPLYGLGYYLMKAGLIETNPIMSVWTVVLVDVWRSLPTAVLVIYSGLRAIPKAVEEAALADGLAGPRKFLAVDLPLVSPQILTAFILTALTGFFTFDPIYIGTAQAGPRILNNLAYYSYEAFSDGEFGYSAMLIVVMTAIGTGLSLAYMKALSARTFVRLPAPTWIPRRELPKALHYAVLALDLAFVALPLGWLILMSVKPPGEIIQIPPSILPSRLDASNYLQALSGGLPFFLMSIYISAINSVVTILLAAMTAYQMRVHGLGGGKLVAYILYLMSTPTLVYIVPLFLILRELKILNTLWALVLTYPIMTLPYSIWILYNYYSGFDKRIEEAALADGMSRIKAFVRAVLPLSRSGMSVAGLYAFLFSWGALIFPLAFTSTPYNLAKPLSFSGAQTFSIYIGELMSPIAMSYGGVAAAGILSAIPPLVYLVAVRRNLEKIWGAG